MESSPTDEPSLELVDALLEQLQSLLQVHVWPVPPVHRRQRKVRAVAVRGVRRVADGAVQIDPVEFGLGSCGVKPAEEEVDGVRLARAERVRELKARPGGGGGGAEGNVVPANEAGEGELALLVLDGG